MKRLTEKLRSKRGETLVEMIVSIMILGLSISLMATMIITAYNMTDLARRNDDNYKAEFENAARMIHIDPEVTATVRITPVGAIDSTKTVDIAVTLNGTTAEGDALRSYSVQP